MRLKPWRDVFAVDIVTSARCAFGRIMSKGFTAGRLNNTPGVAVPEAVITLANKRVAPRLARIWTVALLGLIALGLGVQNGQSQVANTATITGVVSDASGARVPSAAVTVTSENTHVTLTTKTDPVGNFVVPALAVGTYTVTVSKHGFRTFVESGIQLHPALVWTVNPTLQVGQSATRVSVSASAVAIQTTTPEISQHITRQEVSTLPMNGRNFQSIAALMPGVTNTHPGVALSATADSSTVISTNGSSSSGTVYYLDGIWDMDSGSLGNVSVTPNPDTIQEVRVLQSNYGVRYNMMGDGVIVMQTKSGTTKFHGGAWEYLRNTSLNARNYFSQTVPPLHQNIFGYTFGGPLYIPHHFNTNRNKVFFFASQQWTRLNQGGVERAASPTVAMRNGIFPTTGPFATTITNPATGLPFPNNTIPTTLLNPSAIALLNALVPLPNNPAGGFDNYINASPSINNFRQDLFKVDYMINDKLRLTGEYFDDRGQITNPYGWVSGVFASQEKIQSIPEFLTKLQLTQILSPSMVNTTYVTLDVEPQILSQRGTSFSSQIPGFNEVLPVQGLNSGNLPIVNFSQGWQAFGSQPWEPQTQANHTFGFTDDWSWLRGKHYLQAGITYLSQVKRQLPGVPINGNWTFSGQFTGNAMADFLIGDAATFSYAFPNPRAFGFNRTVSPYVEDQWHATKRLTFTLGLRVSYLPGLVTAKGQAALFIPALYNLNEAPIVNADGTITPTPTYNPANGMVVNGENGVPVNFGKYANKHNYSWGPSAGFAWDIFGDGSTSLRGGFGIAYTREQDQGSNVWSATTNPPVIQSLTLVTPNFPNPTGGQVAPAGTPQIQTQPIDAYPAPATKTYSLSLERRFGSDWFASIAGVGADVVHVPLKSNINQPFEDSPYDYNPIINSGTVTPYLFSPYQGYGPIRSKTTESVLHWDALELRLQHTMSHGVLGGVSYTWQNTLGDTSGSLNLFGGGGTVQNIHNLRGNYGPVPYNARQMLAGDIIWAIPLFSDATGWKRNVLGGWRYSDITTIQSGFTLSPGLSVPDQGIATLPDRVERNVAGPKTVSKWFNTAAFAAPAAGYFGNASIGSITGPGSINFDMALYKDFHINERNMVEFRSEFFNTFNHTNFSGVNTTFGSNNFGQITSAADPRIIEFALRYEF